MYSLYQTFAVPLPRSDKAFHSAKFVLSWVYRGCASGGLLKSSRYTLVNLDNEAPQCYMESVI